MRYHNRRKPPKPPTAIAYFVGGGPIDGAVLSMPGLEDHELIHHEESETSRRVVAYRRDRTRPGVYVFEGWVQEAKA